MTTDRESSFTDSSMRIIGYDMSREAARQVYEASGTGPRDIDVVELHDCFTANELVTYEALGLLSKGHPLGATGLAQCAELVWQLRG